MNFQCFSVCTYLGRSVWVRSIAGRHSCRASWSRGGWFSSSVSWCERRRASGAPRLSAGWSTWCWSRLVCSAGRAESGRLAACSPIGAPPQYDKQSCLQQQNNTRVRTIVWVCVRVWVCVNYSMNNLRLFVPIQEVDIECERNGGMTTIARIVKMGIQNMLSRTFRKSYYKMRPMTR